MKISRTTLPLVALLSLSSAAALAEDAAQGSHSIAKGKDIAAQAKADAAAKTQAAGKADAAKADAAPAEHAGAAERTPLPALPLFELPAQASDTARQH